MAAKITDPTMLRARAMKEAEVESFVEKSCADLGIRYMHTHRSQYSPAGYPDDTIVGNGLLGFAENKRQTEKPSAAQQGWLDDLRATGALVFVWRPMDMLDGTILRDLVPFIGSQALRQATARATGWDPVLHGVGQRP